MAETLSYTGSLTITNCWCGIRYAVPDELYKHAEGQHRNGEKQDGIFCPAGHSWIFSGESEASRLRKQLESANRTIEGKRRREEALEKERDQAVRHARSQKGISTRLKKRIVEGKCPCCHSEFKNLAAHMESQHPTYSKPVSAPVIKDERKVCPKS